MRPTSELYSTAPSVIIGLPRVHHICYKISAECQLYIYAELTGMRQIGHPGIASESVLAEACDASCV